MVVKGNAELEKEEEEKKKDQIADCQKLLSQHRNATERLKASQTGEKIHFDKNRFKKTNTVTLDF